jgi:hypothetical protein
LKDYDQLPDNGKWMRHKYHGATVSDDWTNPYVRSDIFKTREDRRADAYVTPNVLIPGSNESFGGTGIQMNKGALMPLPAGLNTSVVEAVNWNLDKPKETYRESTELPLPYLNGGLEGASLAEYYESRVKLKKEVLT